MKINLIEKKGMYVNGKEILLGGDIKTAKEVLGSCSIHNNAYYFLDSMLAFWVDNNKKIIAMEVRNPGDNSITAVFHNLKIFKTKRADLLRHMEAFNKAPLLNEEKGFYEADNLGVRFSFGVSEEDVEDIIRESKRDGIYEEMKESIEGDIYRSQYADTFLIGQ